MRGLDSVRIRPVQIWIVVSFVLALLAVPAAAQTSPEDAESGFTKAEIIDVMACLVPQVRGEGWRGEQLQQAYYRPEQLDTVSDAIVETQRVVGLSDRFTEILLGFLFQQSRFQADAVSRFNRDSEGTLMEPRRDVWKKAQRGMDYGIAQLHWPFGFVPSIAPWSGARKPTVEELADPRLNILLAGEWLKRRSKTCHQLRKSRRKKPCRKDPKSMSCRCVRTKRATGAWWYNAAPDSIGSVMRKVDRCIRKVRDSKS